jgi:hypothetical protein
MSNTEALKVGDIVRYAAPTPEEAALTFVLIELNGDRAIIKSRDFPTWRFPPQELVATADIALVEGNPCQACANDPLGVPGVLLCAVYDETLDEDVDEIQRCDDCKVFESDEEARAAVAKRKG